MNQIYEYHVVPAPRRGNKVRGAKTSEDRFAHAIAEVINNLAVEGWEYQRTDTLPCEERQGLTGRTTVFQNLLIFRRTCAERSVVQAPSVKAEPDGSETERSAEPRLGPASREAAPQSGVAAE